MPFALPVLITSLLAIASRFRFLSGVILGGATGYFYEEKPFWQRLGFLDITAMAGLLIGFALLLREVKGFWR